MKRPIRRARGEADAVRFIRDGIRDGLFEPNERLVETDLARQIGVDRRVIRLALARLEQEGLVVITPNRGARVRRVSDREAIEILEARGALELLVARHAARHATEAEKDTLRQHVLAMETAVSAGNFIAYSQANGAFHQALQQAARHETAAQLLERLRSQAVRFQYQSIVVAGRAPQSLAEHRAILAAVEASDPEAAELAMRLHLDGVIAGLRETMAENRAVAGL
ncbi:GntR family transcriptional regulator [Alkalilacustris brevis]|uniref:GntR family transcriptional regulator n=1 Tax=Alkalilacustris brevis TaxID=2026338 RepID=UPI000E0DBB17|nr:GntR family transcriptional regulator [Alkalilacustris brevis]